MGLTDRWGMNDFKYQHLDVYRAAIDFFAVADELSAVLPRSRAYLVEPLRRAATSIPVDIIDGELSPDDKATSYWMARRSAIKCSAILDTLHTLNLADSQLLSKGHALLLQIVTMLGAMAVGLSESDLG